MSNKIQLTTCTLGCDPELFISNKAGEIVGSERAIPENGVITNTGKIIRDGVQVEFNPSPATCRAYLGGYIATQFRTLRDTLSKTEFKIDLSPVIRVPHEELEALSEKSKLLGCAPSENQYKDKPDLTLTPANRNLRSAGGHIHLSTACKPDDLIPIMDLIVGNTFVLIDRDPMQVERRKLYGRAGEYRVPQKGARLEYRTLSNVWLRSYPLFTLAMGLARMANSIVLRATDVGYTYYPTPVEKEAYAFLKNGLNTDRLQAAINQNDFDLAMENYALLRDFIKTYVASYNEYDAKHNTNFPLWPSALRWWRYFVKMGLDHWFKQDPVTHWCNLRDGHGKGWEAFLVDVVKPEYEKNHPKKPKEEISK